MRKAMVELREIAQRLREWDDILIVSHASPDGDTLGSASALLRLLDKLGKRASFKCADGIPQKYDFMFEGLKLSDKPCERIVTVDVADIRLLGSLKAELEGKIDIAIDHHSTHVSFAEIEYVEAKSASTAEIVYELYKLMDTEISLKAAECIYTGITTDTGCFRYGNTTPRSHRIAAEMMEIGADTEKIDYEMFMVKTRNQLDAELEAMSGMKFFCDGRIASMTVPRTLMDKYGLRNEDTEALASKPRLIEGVLIGITLKEKENGGWKVSVRTNKNANAAEICKKLGGGGHKGAAGAEIAGTDGDTAKQKAVGAAKQYIEESGI